MKRKSLLSLLVFFVVFSLLLQSARSLIDMGDVPEGESRLHTLGNYSWDIAFWRYIAVNNQLYVQLEVDGENCQCFTGPGGSHWLDSPNLRIFFTGLEPEGPINTSAFTLDYYISGTMPNNSTGLVVYEARIVPSGNEPDPPPEPEPTCHDSDGGNNPLVFGMINKTNSSGTFNYFDTCGASNTVYEYYCSGTSEAITYHDCDLEYGDNWICEDGACVEEEEEEPEESNCTDSDGGQEYDVQGALSITGPYSGTWTDVCQQSTGRLIENWCVLDNYGYYHRGYGYFTCSNIFENGICVDGACVAQEGNESDYNGTDIPPVNETEDDPENETQEEPEETVEEPEEQVNETEEDIEQEGEEYIDEEDDLVSPELPEINIERLNIELDIGWNLIGIPGELTRLVDDDCSKRKDILASDYLDRMGDYQPGTRAQNTMWVYNFDSGCDLGIETVKGSRVQSLDIISGWNVVPITHWMLGKSLDELSSGCNIDSAYLWNADEQDWGMITTEDVLSSDLYGKGAVISSFEDCVLK